MISQEQTAQSPLSLFLSFRTRWGVVAAASLLAVSLYGAYRVVNHFRK